MACPTLRYQDTRMSSEQNFSPVVWKAIDQFSVDAEAAVEAFLENSKPARDAVVKHIVSTIVSSTSLSVELDMSLIEKLGEMDHDLEAFFSTNGWELCSGAFTFNPFMPRMEPGNYSNEEMSAKLQARNTTIIYSLLEPVADIISTMKIGDSKMLNIPLEEWMIRVIRRAFPKFSFGYAPGTKRTSIAYNIRV